MKQLPILDQVQILLVSCPEEQETNMSDTALKEGEAKESTKIQNQIHLVIEQQGSLANTGSKEDETAGSKLQLDSITSVVEQQVSVIDIKAEDSEATKIQDTVNSVIEGENSSVFILNSETLDQATKFVQQYYMSKAGETHVRNMVTTEKTLSSVVNPNNTTLFCNSTSSNRDSMCTGRSVQSVNNEEHSVTTINTKSVTTNMEPNLCVDNEASGSILFTVSEQMPSNQTINSDEISIPGETVDETMLEDNKKCSIEEEKPFRCSLCSAQFSSQGNLSRHGLVHAVYQEDSEDRFKCKECGKHFLQRCDLIRHQPIHTGTQPHRCDICGKGYIRKSDLQTHLRFHNKTKCFKCDMCSKAFCQSGDLKRHVRLVHLKLKKLTCGHCGKKYAADKTLLRHVQTTHRNVILKCVAQTKDALFNIKQNMDS